MRHKYKLFLFLFTTSFIFLLFSQNVIGIVNENDINFSWISTELYEQENPYDFTVDDSLNHTTYNNTDFYQHTEGFEGINYTNDDYEGWDISTASFIQSITTKSSIAFGIFFSLDGLQMYESDYDSHLIHQSTLTIPWDISTVSFNQSISSIDTLPFGIYFNQEGFKMYEIGDTGNSIYESTLTNAWDISTASFMQSISTQSTSPSGLCFSLNGLEMYESDALSDLIYQSTLTIPWDISTASFKQSIATQDTYTGEIFLGHDGLKMYEIEYSSDSIHESTLTTSWDISTASLTRTISTQSGSSPRGIFFSSNGLRMYEMTGNNIYQLNLDNSSSIINYYPEIEGLFDAVDNINVSLDMKTDNITYYNNTSQIGMYNSSYTFTGESGVAIGWVDTSTASCSVDVIPEFQGHTYVIELDDVDGGQCFITNSFSNQVSGTIELWMSVDQATWYNDVGCIGNAEFYFIMRIDKFQYYSGGYQDITGAPIPQDNEWYHIRMDFECGAGAYLGLSPDTVRYTINGINYGDYAFATNGNFISSFKAQTTTVDIGYTFYIDAIGYSWLSNYTIGDNILHSFYVANSFRNSLIFMNNDFEEIIDIGCIDGLYRINDVNTNYNVFLNVSDNWKIRIEIDQILENGTLYLYNESQSLLFSIDFDTAYSGNVKYIKYVQYYQNTTHFVNISNFSIYSNNTFISGNNGFMSYALDLDDTNVWNLAVSSSLTLIGYGRYRFYVSNDTYDINNSITQLCEWYDMRNSSITLDLSSFTDRIINPYLIIESMNGMYLLDYIRINGSATLYDDRNYMIEGISLTSNVDTDNSYFYVISNRLYYQITFDDINEEYIKLSFDISNIVNENYQLLYKAYQNCSESSIIKQIKIKHTDASYTNIDIPSYYVSNIEILNQEKTTSQIEFLISDNDLQDNLTISGYFEGFTYNYNEQVSLSLFIDQMLIMLIPIIIILALTFGLSVALKPEKSKDMLNREAFFPIFLISSIIVFVLGFFDTWILFSIIISAVLYLITKRGDKS